MSFTLFYKRPLLEKKSATELPWRFNNYKHPVQNKGLDGFSKPTDSSRKHHQTAGRIMGSNGDRKNLNLVARSESPQMINQTVENFIKSGDSKKRIDRLEANKILIQMGINPDPETWENQYVRLRKSNANMWYVQGNFWLVRNS